MKNKGGRPTKYTKNIAMEICRMISEGKSLRSICKSEDMPTATTVFNWLLDDRKKWFLEQYAHARNVQAEVMFEELLDIADETNRVINSGAEKKSSAYAQAQRLRVDTRKWYLSKVLPKKFGDKLDLTSDGKKIESNTIVIKRMDGTASK